ncbi:pantoate--beta-alanine ligase [Pokkaliibacter plantistimulans]|uniref:Pantothenate synthetase n=1 Tax=Pokkaliibacter plantistimulans TaxID=1635171 RepID=A0ABX5LY89_9GAMM|nr:pantoate--beta-alanine ligase [Pokkaliibacter plantistimulans]PXF30148.1 pantoate--beta-alanine ligase [Pokkaliibacter plantistimulans]
MLVLPTIAELRQQLHVERMRTHKIAFVPTMGNLHDGHISLIHKAREEADVVVASIFVNPLQFGANEDLERYPRTFAEDSAKLEESGCDYLFAPSVEEMYPQGLTSQTIVDVPRLSSLHCGASRPGHFRGVATVVAKLFGIVQPDVAIFGLKDFQQLAVIRQMVNDLCLPVTILGAEIARAESGLALSSRNGYLTSGELQTAPLLYQTLQGIEQRITAGEVDFRQLEAEAKQQLNELGLEPDYFNICNQATLELAESDDKQLVILAASYLGKARLIDNIRIQR